MSDYVSVIIVLYCVIITFCVGFIHNLLVCVVTALQPHKTSEHWK